MNGSLEVAFWTATRHLVRKAAGYTPDQATHEAYEVVIAHTDDVLVGACHEGLRRLDVVGEHSDLAAWCGGQDAVEVARLRRLRYCSPA
jgi:hypothetical protein